MALTGGNIGFTGYQQPDYSGVVQAAGLPMQAIGQGIAQAEDYFKQQGEKKKLIKKSDVQIDAALKLFPDLAPTLQSFREQIKDENLPLDERMAIADTISNTINLGIGELRGAASARGEQQKLAMEQTYKAARLGLEERRVGAAEKTAKESAAPKYEFKEFNVIDPEGNVYKKELPYNPKTGRAVDTNANKEILDVQQWFEGKPAYAEGQAIQTSQIGGSFSDLIANAASMSVGKSLSADTAGTKGGKLGCADAVCQIFSNATGEELVPGGTLSTSEMSSSLASDQRFVKIPVDEASKGDIVLTPRGKVAGHVGIVVDGGRIVSNSSAGFKGGKPGTVAENYSIDSWVKNVSPRNLTQTAAYRYVGSEGIDNALSMTGDRTQEAMGTSEQQSEMARLIQQGEGLSVATTEQGMPAPLQEPIQQPRFTPRAGFIPVKRDKTSTVMTPEQVQNLATQGYKIDAVPTNDGNFAVSGVSIGGQAGETFEFSEGRFKMTRGGAAGGKTEAAAEAQEKQSLERTKGIIGAAADSINMIKSDLSENSVIARAQQGLSIVLPASTEGRIAKNLETVKILNSKEEVNKARAASPTGSAGGNITENEWKIFQNNFGTLEVGMHPPDLLSNLQKTSLNQFEAVNGRPEDVIKLFNNGKITKPAFDEYIKEYKQTRSILGIPDTGTGGPGDDWTKYNPNLLRFDKEKQSQLSPEAQAMQDRIDALKANQ